MRNAVIDALWEPTDAACPEASVDDDPADIRRLATAGLSPVRQEEEVVWSWLILRSEDPVNR